MQKMKQIIADPSPKGYALGTVIESEQGQALALLSQGRRIKVYAHGAHVEALKCGDEVLFVDIDNGAYIVARSRRPEEKPLQPASKQKRMLLSTNEATNEDFSSSII